jgi:hypothetical protein
MNVFCKQKFCGFMPIKNKITKLSKEDPGIFKQCYFCVI